MLFRSVGYVLPALAPWCALLALALADRMVACKRTAVVSAVVCVVVVGGIAWKVPYSAHETAQVLREQWRPGDRVVFVDEYLYDLPFYAQLREPVWVLSRWNDADIAQRDNWRKELHDALRFATPQSRAYLVPFEEAARVTCTSGQVWWVGRQDPRQQFPSLAQSPSLQALQPVHQARQVQLWRSAGQPC